MGTFLQAIPGSGSGDCIVLGTIPAFSAFNVIAYGADPTGTNDSTSAIQSAFNAAIAAQSGTVYFPPGYYLVTSTITVACNGTNGVNVIGASGSGNGVSCIDYQGPDGTACFAITGMNNSHWQGIGVNLGGTGAANQVAFDFQTTSSEVNQAGNLMQCINVSLQGTGGGHIGFRLGQYSTGYTDEGSNIADTTLLHCTINGDYQGSGHPPSTSIGMQFGGSQVKISRVIGCAVGGLGCDYLVGSIASTIALPSDESITTTQTYIPVNDVTLFKPNGSNTRYVVLGQGGSSPEQCTYTGVTVNTDGWTGTLTGVTRGVNETTPYAWPGGTTVKEYQPGVGVYSGGDDIIWVECGGTSSLRIFYIQAAGGSCYTILGGRWELLEGTIGQRFLQTGYVGSDLTQSITVKSVQLAGFTPPTDLNGVIWLTGNVNLEWTGGAASPQSGAYNDGTNGYFLTNNSYGGSYGAVNFNNFLITASASALPWNIINSWPVNADLLFMDDDGEAIDRYRQIQMCWSTDTNG
jgi:hypothetical protein